MSKSVYTPISIFKRLDLHKKSVFLLFSSSRLKFISCSHQCIFSFKQRFQWFQNKPVTTGVPLATWLYVASNSGAPSLQIRLPTLKHFETPEGYLLTVNWYNFTKEPYQRMRKPTLAKWIPRVLGIPRNSNLFQDMQMSKDKKPWNIWEYLGMG